MLGLRTQVSGRAPVMMALNQEHYVVTAGASWRREANTKSAGLTLHGTGIDDREDHLEWFVVADAIRGSWIEITVVDIAIADSPRRKPRRRVDWPAHFRAERMKDRRRIAELFARLKQTKHGRAWVSRPELASPRDPAVGFLVTLNGRPVGRVGVGDPGALSVDIVLRQRPGGAIARLNVHGGENLGGAWRWRSWEWEGRQLQVSDQLRIEVVEPDQLDLGRIREVKSYEPQTEEQIRDALKILRRSVRTRHSAKAARMKALDEDRPAPRRYPRTPIRLDMGG